MLANHIYAHFYALRLRSLLVLQPSVLWLSIVTLNNYVKPRGVKVNFARIWCITNPTPTSLDCLTLKRWHGKIWPQLKGLPYVADRATHLEGSPHLSCKRDAHLGSPPPCKQALKVSPAPFLQFQQLHHLLFESILHYLSLTFTTW